MLVAVDTDDLAPREQALVDHANRVIAPFDGLYSHFGSIESARESAGVSGERVLARRFWTHPRTHTHANLYAQESIYFLRMMRLGKFATTP